MSVLEQIQRATGAWDLVARAKADVHEVAPQFGPTATAAVPLDVPQDTLYTAGGIIIGAVAWHDHRILGAISGASLCTNVPALFKPATRKVAIDNLVRTGAGIVGARILPGSPTIGFLAGWGIASGVMFFKDWKSMAGGATGAAASPSAFGGGLSPVPT